jgi:phthiocerol/phenolphthiocerol synthesis type-I polyketide synthase E
MLAVSLSAEAVAPFVSDGVALAAVNAPELCVLSGTEAAIAAAERALAQAGHAARRLAATHAFHSPLMAPVAEQVAALAARMRLSAPRIPMLSNVTGGWLTAAEATDPAYWSRHLLGTVRFAEGAARLLSLDGCVLVEAGPGGSLCTFVRQQASAGGVAAPLGVASLPHAAEGTPEPAFLLGAMGRLWTAGARPRFADGADHVPLPLPALAGGTDAAEMEEAAGEVALVLAGIWSELLGVPAGPNDDFFLLGGHSLVATRLIARVHDAFGVQMRLRTLFQTRTVAGMARWIEENAPVRHAS